MPQVFRPYADTIARLVLLAILIVPFAAIGVAYGVMWSPFVTGENVTLKQPVPFSHEHHVGGLGLDCRYCHDAVEKSPVASVPPTYTCMTCHSQLYTNAEMLAPVRESLARGVPIQWNRVHRLPAYVYFDHSIHLAKGVGCSTCHGRIDTMPLVRQTQPLTMSWCLECHRSPAPNLRPLADLFRSDWKPGADQDQKGERLLREYGIETGHLTDCSTCHR
ncbi:cytochrome c3 family protein [Methylocystis heyeri]|uniref:Cytochrome C n=1 Tax=Methylocystis heyeri TaxID=391905 RepID=A0A6B8K7Z8_9HYPH|nr:cytochrome c3 family protein [Methylocystis heyeri]QGM44334.1 cytochrome C [Methylocystis heyeri]